MTAIEIEETINSLNYWYPKYYLPTIFHVFVVFLLIIISPLKVRKDLSEFNFTWLSSLYFIGFISYFLIFFKQFRDHDYYFLPLIPTLFIISLTSIAKIFSISNYVLSCIIIVLIALVALLGYNYSSLNMNRKFSNSIDSHSIVSYQLRNISSVLAERQIPSEAKFIVIGDRTLNGSLVFLNRFGWTYPDFKLDLGSVESNLPLADYLLILKPSENRVPEHIRQKLTKCKVYSYNSNFIYDLRAYPK